MDINSMASAFSDLVAAKTAASVQVAVAAKVADSQRDLGDAMLQLLQAANTGFGNAAQSVVTSSQLDILA